LAAIETAIDGEDLMVAARRLSNAIMFMSGLPGLWFLACRRSRRFFVLGRMEAGGRSGRRCLELMRLDGVGPRSFVFPLDDL
jgi:hypothetical protein